MKKRAVFLFLISAIFAAAAIGCGQKEQADSNDTNTTENGENFAVDSTGTEADLDTEGTSQLQLGSAVEIPASFESRFAETEAHPQLEKAIAEYCSVPEADFGRVRYYYNYVDLNNDSQNEILALVLGQEVAGIDGNLLLWLDEPEDEKITSHSIRQAFRQVGVPIYISNHMTEGYLDLIITQDENAENGPAEGEEVNVENGGRDVDGEETSLQETAGLDETTGTNGAQLLSIDQTYLLLVWKGDKYQELEEGAPLSSLDGYEGTAILTNNTESDIANDNYHFLGEGTQT